MTQQQYIETAIGIDLWCALQALAKEMGDDPEALVRRAVVEFVEREANKRETPKEHP